MKHMKIGDKVKIKNSTSRKIGIVKDVYEIDVASLDKNGKPDYFVIKGQLKIKFQISRFKFYISTHSSVELEKV